MDDNNSCRRRSPPSDDNDDGDRRSSKKSHKRKREHKHSRVYSGSDSGQSDDDCDASHLSDERYKRKRRKEKSKKHSKKSHRSDDDSSDERYKKRRKEKKSKKSKKKAKKIDYRRSRSRSPSSDQSRGTHQAAHVPPGAHELASSLSTLFESYPAMTSIDEGGIPLLLIQLSRGTEYNLSSMPDTRLANLIGGVFAALRVHGMELLNGVWKWGNAPPGSRGGDDLALIKLARALLASVGVSMDSVEGYEEAERKRRASQQVQPIPEQKGPVKSEQPEESEEAIRHRKRIERMSTSMLDRFDSKDSLASAESTLANELQGIISVLKDGETVQLQGLENGKLKVRATRASLL